MSEMYNSPKPEDLVDALQDPIHVDIGNSRPAYTSRMLKSKYKEEDLFASKEELVKHLLGEDEVNSENISCNTCKYNDRRKDTRHVSSLFYCSKNYRHMLDDEPCKFYMKDDD